MWYYCVWELGIVVVNRVIDIGVIVVVVICVYRVVIVIVVGGISWEDAIAWGLLKLRLLIIVIWLVIIKIEIWVWWIGSISKHVWTKRMVIVVIPTKDIVIGITTVLSIIVIAVIGKDTVFNLTVAILLWVIWDVIGFRLLWLTG